ncbi:MAG: MATE family efflux transporter [Thermofilaceae archaeon]
MYKVLSKAELKLKVLKTAWPIIFSELVDSMYSIADTYFVSRLGTNAIAAVGAGSYLCWLMMSFPSLFMVGVLVMVAQYNGAGDLDSARRTIGETLLYGSIAICFIAIAAFTAAPHVVLLLVSSENLELLSEAIEYFRVRVIGLPLIAVALIMDSAVRAVKATKYSMIVVSSSALTNIVLDPLLIYGSFNLPPLGVRGAALATVLSETLMIPLEIIFIRKLKLSPILELHSLKAANVFKVGLPAFIERLLMSIGNNAYAAFIARCGAKALAAHQIGLRIESFIYMPGFAFSVVASSYVGERIGAGEFKEGKVVGLEIAKLAVVTMFFLGIAAATLSKILVKPFSVDQEVLELASLYLVLAGLSEAGLALAMSFSGALRGAGNTIVPLLISAIGLYLFRVVPTSILTKFIGVVGAWISMFVDVYLRGVILYAIYVKYFDKLAVRWSEKRTH